jgi:NADP-dependent 3-hydroxy acid dehydrogenase YdfG
MSMANRLWEMAKTGITVPLGPVRMLMKAEKSVKVSRNSYRGIPGWLRRRFKGGGTANRHEYAEKNPWEKQLLPRDTHGETAVIVGAGPGFGAALARRFAMAGMNVVMIARNTDKLMYLLPELLELGGTGHTFPGDATDEATVKALFRHVEHDFGVPSLVIVNMEKQIPGGILEIDTSAFEQCWRSNCLSGFLVGREAARLMEPKQRGTIIFTGLTASVRGNVGYINMAVGKFGLRALAQSMARELGPKGIHVVHTILDSGIFSERSRPGAEKRMSSMHPSQLSDAYYHLHTQHQSAWTHEIDFRPWTEPF